MPVGIRADRSGDVMANQEYETICSRVREWVREVGVLARERQGRAVASRKADRSVVTDIDHAVQDILLERIGRDFPADAAITEETQKAPGRHAAVGSAARCWVIDPIDGTRNYARGFPLFTISVGLMEAGRPVLGVIHNPMTGNMYSAFAGGGAWLDGAPMAAVDRPMSGSTIIGVPSAREAPLPGIMHRWMDRMVLRNTGSTALHLALVASGAMDAACSDDCRLWDIAAGAVIASEAGAIFVRPTGEPHFPMDLASYTDQNVPFIVAGPALAAALVAEYQAAI